MPLPHDPGPHWGEVGIHGLHRHREWDLVTTVESTGLEGDEAWFVALLDGRVVTEEGMHDPSPLADAVALAAPCRAHAVRRDLALWVVGARRIETVTLVEDPGGEAVELAWDGRERTVRIDGEPTLAGVPELERLASARHATYVVTALRLEGDVGDLCVAALTGGLRQEGRSASSRFAPVPTPSPSCPSRTAWAATASPGSPGAGCRLRWRRAASAPGCRCGRGSVPGGSRASVRRAGA